MAVTNQIGQMSHYVQVVKFTSVKSDIGSNERTQVAVKSVWAALQIVSSTENVEDKVYSVNKRNYIIHYDEDITALLLQDLAVIENSEIYYVTGYNAEYGERNQYILLNCKRDV